MGNKPQEFGAGSASFKGLLAYLGRGNEFVFSGRSKWDDLTRSDVENAKCNGSGASDQHRDSFPFMQPPTTLSTFNAI
jgi:hypothetical protein